jgi:hypothetical protein
LWWSWPQIEGGGKGVLVSLASLARRYAKLHTLSGVNGLFTLYLEQNRISSYDASSNVEDWSSSKFPESAKPSILSTR